MTGIGTTEDVPETFGMPGDAQRRDTALNNDPAAIGPAADQANRGVDESVGSISGPSAEADLDAAIEEGRAVVSENMLTDAELRDIIETGPSVGVYGCYACGGAGWIDSGTGVPTLCPSCFGASSR